MSIALILDLYLLDAFATVSLSRDPTISLILWTRSSVLLWGFKLTLNSETPNVIQSKWLQSGKLGVQISFSHTSVRLSLSQTCGFFLLWAGAQSSWKMEWQFPAIWSILRHHLSNSCSEMFISCARYLMILLRSLVMSFSRMVARTVSLKTLFLLFINVSEDPPQVIN